MSFVVVGTNHRHSPISLRERLSFSKKRLGDALNLLMERGVLRGAVILSTCNRVEVYASTDRSENGIAEIEDFISRYHKIDRERFSPYFYRYIGRRALKHLFRVASGLDSMVLGETQILGQVRSAFLEADHAAFTDEVLDGLFNSAIFSAHKIHKETAISEGKVSIGSVAVDFIKARLGDLSGKNILIIGVGKVTGLVLRYLKKEEPKVVFISNRTFEKAERMADEIGAEAVRFDSLDEYLKKTDILITATASPHLIIKKETVQKALNSKPGTRNSELLIIDLALPRDVDPRVSELKDVGLFGLEDFNVIIEQNRRRKAQEADKVKRIIDIEVDDLWPRFTESAQEKARLL